MRESIYIKTDYSLLKSVIKISDLISYAKENNISTLGIIDNNLSSSAEFIDGCIKNNIKPVIGLDTFFLGKQIILYAKNYQGLLGLFKINTFILEEELNIIEITKYIKDLVVLLPYESHSLYNELANISSDVFISYNDDIEKTTTLIITENVVPFHIALALKQEDTEYINYLNMIKDSLTIDEYDMVEYSHNFLRIEDVSKLTKLINIIPEKHKNLIPHYDETIKDSYKYLEGLAVKGLAKRLDGKIPNDYKKRLLFELKVIKEMGFVDYFLIVYDCVKYAVNNDILIVCRGSAAGSLVTYSLGITSVDPIKYNLLFERFLNPERVSMPDIDMDFDASKRSMVIDHVKERYGKLNTLGIMTYGTLAARACLIAVAKLLNTDIEKLLKIIDSNKSLQDNLSSEVEEILNSDEDIKKVYYDAMKLEGIKKHISTHAAGVVIANTQLDNVIPIIKSGDEYLTGYTMNYLEDLGLLKTDFLAINNLSLIAEILKITPSDFNIKTIDLDIPEVLARFTHANTVGIFQFESAGMKSFLRKLKPDKFTDLVVANALWRPGPMQNIDSFIARKEGKEKIDYLVPALEPILKETYGIIVYQEQIMQIFNIMAGYSVAEADIIRRAISKKQEDIIESEKERFILKTVKNKYTKEKAEEIYDLIMKFANYGFNKSHSVVYALVAYQMMYLKVHYPEEFYTSLYNINIGSSSKTKEYIDEAKFLGIKILKPDINESSNRYQINQGIRMPFNIIKNIGEVAATDITEERGKGKYIDFFDFVARTYGKSVNTKTIENLIYAGAFDSFNETRASLIHNINAAIIYAELISGLDSSLVAKPTLDQKEEFSINELMEKELELFGFYTTNHPASKYGYPKLNTIADHFDTIITTVGLVENIKAIKTKNGDTMAFLDISDETGRLDYTLFPNKIDYINRIKKGDLLEIVGKVERREDKYQIVVNKITVIKD